MFAGQTVTYLPHVSKGVGGEENLFLLPIISAGIWFQSASYSGHFVTDERVPGTHWTGNRGGPRASLGIVTKGTITALARN
jgi:hypothetical protein